MPIAQLQAETARATGVYTWTTKPPAAGNAGLEIIVSDLNNTKWRSDGTYWRPANGSQIIYAADLSLYSTTATTEQSIAGYTSPVIPWNDLMRTPNFLLRTSLSALRTSPQTTQGVLMRAPSLWSGDDVGLFYVSSTSSNPCISAYGEVGWVDSSTYARTSSAQSMAVSIYQRDTRPISNITAGSAITIAARTGGAGETIKLCGISIEYRA